MIKLHSQRWLVLDTVTQNMCHMCTTRSTLTEPKELGMIFGEVMDRRSHGIEQRLCSQRHRIIACYNFILPINFVHTARTMTG